ncbi:tRNA (adenosine(37)-N6)-threonylcarbamoyltransferase complex ATPase subunit type 1 TsaE [Hoeflea sp. WL0058]|uniref:tRNA threonylcarbamoyladenosine biosynthesis protein TsaE n=1 Tax=Flavimaribacter sediminis TaxID=2865987 RepID=A0AAE3D270_9HYPH|nr:tRNA (adenosine(37)-N6)-threonylcarbamoyltransferase complex ATPase subunit type 1 TsaE [Flavimaribacter sediminis]MBW8638228.1 tRNA (adenosine(37)-N6)-threonylcarbamoyltransferase complex ATPase subunit type 1 TsaE [Flavimaribacter sediminis]
MTIRTETLQLENEAATAQLGQDLALAVAVGDCVALAGDLGAGKSTLARALIRAIADDDELEAPSPTFTLVQTYELRLPVAHIDLYRISDPQEIDELGLDDALATGVALIEWPERAEGELPDETIQIAFAEAGAGRSVTISGPPEPMDRIARTLRIRAFLDKFRPGAQRRYFQGDASTRRFELIRGENGEALFLMDSPEKPAGPVVRDGKAYTAIAHTALTVAPFVAIADFLRASGFRVPEIVACLLDDGILLVSDLGRTGVLDAHGLPIEERLSTAIDCLVKLHRTAIPPSIPVSGGPDYVIPPYDADAMMIEVELYLDWYLPQFAGETVTAGERDRYIAAWRAVIDRLQNTEQSLVLRDFHSPNLLWNASGQGTDQIGIVDFQDALTGPAAYDVASLVHDARVTVDPRLAKRLVARYLDARGDDADFDKEGFLEALAITQAQRATKILGIFVRLKERDGKPGYIAHLPRIRAYLAEALRHPALNSLHEHYYRAGIGPDES